jgi:hypothetical protein
MRKQTPKLLSYVPSVTGDGYFLGNEAAKVRIHRALSVYRPLDELNYCNF